MKITAGANVWRKVERVVEDRRIYHIIKRADKRNWMK